MKLSGHTVLITGGASGIGLALAHKFIQNDNMVIVIGRNESKLKSLESQFPRSVAAYTCDLADEVQVSRLIEQLAARHPKLSVLINNAAIQYNYSFIDSLNNTDRIKDEITINLTMPISLTSSLLPLLLQHEQAAIVNVSSGLGLVPKKSAPVYCATKAGLHIYTQALRYQLENTNVKVFEIIPPIVDTDMTKGRGSNKISPEALAQQFFAYYRKDQLEVPIGKVKWLAAINRWLPSLARSILKNS